MENQNAAQPGPSAASIGSPFFVFDVESIGLHGEPYAVGWVVIDRAGIQLESGIMAIPPEFARGDDSDREWCVEHIPKIEVTHPSLESMLVDFWAHWMRWKQRGAIMFAECAWPVESRFLAMCISQGYPASKWDGPYPLHDVASVMLAAGMDPTGHYDRKAGEHPQHDPLADSRQSARLLLEALNAVNNR